MIELNPYIILSKPQLGENIGSTARAMKNFGIKNLLLVQPRDGWPNNVAFAPAAGADDVLNQAKFAAENCDYLIAVGSSLKVSPANSFIKIAKKNGAQIVILNYDPTPFDSEASIIINEYIEKICDEIT